MLKGISDSTVKEKRIQNDNREKGGRNRCQDRMNPVHIVQRKGHQNHDSEQAGKLLRDKILDGLHVRCTPLNDVSCVILAVPRKRKMLNVIKQLIAHSLDQTLRAE